MRVLHHSQYIHELLKSGKIRVGAEHALPLQQKIVYHDPCELGRNSGVYNEPREVLKFVGELQTTTYDRDESLCCGHSIAAESLPYRKRRLIADDVVEKLSANAPDILATACPACKKAFSETNKIQVKDLAEIVAENLEI
jgi:Fe-S oxidoreductase